MGRRMTPQQAADIIAIQQLAFRYSISADSKDPQTLASLYVERPGTDGRMITRADLIGRFTRSFRRSSRSILNVGTHLVELDPDDPNRATGTVYARCECEFEGEWLIQQIVYLDEYVCENDVWYFWSRKHLLFYGAKLGESPLGLQPADAAELTRGIGSMPQAWESYRRFFERLRQEPPD
jgi:SnoaL-like protein